MMVHLSETDRDLLATLVEREISDLGPEIRHTDTSEFREELKAQKRDLIQLLGRLSPASSVLAANPR